MSPIILITAGSNISPTGKEQWALNHTYHERITEAGGIPMMALNVRKCMRKSPMACF